MAKVGAAASAEHIQPGHAIGERAVLLSELVRIARIKPMIQRRKPNSTRVPSTQSQNVLHVEQAVFLRRKKSRGT